MNKKVVLDYIKSLGGNAVFSGKEWPSTFYVQHRHRGKEWIIGELIKKFTRHTPYRFL